MSQRVGSLSNLLHDNYNPASFPEWKVGEGITVVMWTDRYACTIVKVEGKRVWFQRDRAILLDKQMCDSGQQYKYERDENAEVEMAGLTKRGWRTGKKVGGQSVFPGRDEHYDWSF